MKVSKSLSHCFVLVALTVELSCSLKCRLCESRDCLRREEWETETCSDRREQECVTLSKAGQTIQMGCTEHSCRMLRNNREGVVCRKCDERDNCNEEFAVGTTGEDDSVGGASSRGVGGGGSAIAGSALGGDTSRQSGEDIDSVDKLNSGRGQVLPTISENGEVVGSNRFDGGGGSSSHGDRVAIDGNDRTSGGGSAGGTHRVTVDRGGTGGGSNRFGGTGGGSSSDIVAPVSARGDWPHSYDHGNFQEVRDTEDVYRTGSDVIGSRFCYKCRGEACRDKGQMQRQLCKENKFETCYAVYDANNGTTHEMGCTHYTCTLLRAYVDTNVCEKCVGDFCNHKLHKFRAGMHGRGNGGFNNGGGRAAVQRREFETYDDFVIFSF